MSEHPTERFERPLVPETEHDPAPTFEPLFPDPEPHPAPAPPASAPPERPAPIPPAPPVAPPPPVVPPPPVAPPTAVTPPPVTPEPPGAERTTRLRPARADSGEQSAVAVAARHWFGDADNLLMAVTAAIAVLFIVLVAVLR